MIYVGLDDTDMPGTPGTNQLAKAIVARLVPKFRCVFILRHQLCRDPRIPCTSQNGSATILLDPLDEAPAWDFLYENTRQMMRDWFVEGSDPGLCLTDYVPLSITEFGERCQREMVTQEEARELAEEYGLHLEGLGGTEGGVIGALAAVGLANAGNDGRVVANGTWPDDLSGPTDVIDVVARKVTVKRIDNGAVISSGVVDVRKHLRPNYRGRHVVLFVEPHPDPAIADWLALKLP